MRSRNVLIAFIFSSFAPWLVVAAEPPDFNRHVLPVFRKYCVGCHNTKEAEGSLILQDYQRVIKGHDEGRVITPGKSEASRLWKVLVAQDETRMPPKGKPSPEQEELALIKAWIDAGANPPAGHENSSGLITPKITTRRQVREAITSVAISPDGRLLASSSQDLRIKLWETKTYTQVAVLERQSDWASALAFTSDSRQLLVGRMNGEHQFYPIDLRWADSTNELPRLNETVDVKSPQRSGDLPSFTETEPNDLLSQATIFPVPGIARGELKAANGNTTDVDYYRFEARSGDRLIVETQAARDGSLADTKVEILHADGTPVLRALLQAVRDSWINFRPIDSSSPDVRLEFWEEMDLNQFVYLNGEVCKTFRAPQGPDSGYVLYSVDGKRRGYFDTSASAHAKDEPAYIVEAFPPDSKIVENGLPVFPLYYTNDDDAERKLGKDSRLTLTVPADGTYLIKVTDVRGASGDKFAYQLTVRHPQPDFSLAVTTKNPKVPAGSGQRIKFNLTRLDNFHGPVRIDLAGLPSGFQASSPVVIEAGLYEAHSVLTAAKDAPEPTASDWERITVLATAEISGQLTTRTIGGLGEVKLDKPAPIRVTLVPDDPRWATDDQGLVIEPGTTITAKIIVERNGHQDDVRFDVDNLPHGIIVDNIGLSGVLVRKQETERQIFLTARPWVPSTDRLIHAVAQGVGNQASPAVRLSVRQRAEDSTK